MAKLTGSLKAPKVAIAQAKDGRLKEGVNHVKNDEFGAAVTKLLQVLQANPDDPIALHYLGVAKYLNGDDSQEALTLVRRSVEIAPRKKQATMLKNLGYVTARIGNLSDGEEYLLRAIELKPGDAEAYYNLSQIKKFRDGEPILEKMFSLYAKDDLTAMQREFICFALAKTLDDIGEYPDAFHFAIEANRLNRTNSKEKWNAPSTDGLREQVSPEAMERLADGGDATEQPVFIVGMPRSGTTLVEQILACHPDVVACGESSTILDQHAKLRKTMPDRRVRRSRFAYLSCLTTEQTRNAALEVLREYSRRTKNADARRFTDKTPLNALHLGLVFALFPNARVIHVNRHPLDCCVSNFFQRFRRGQRFSYRFDDLGKMYQHYVEVMDQWRQVLPLRIFDVRYEDLVSDTERHARQLIEFLGLKWSPACLAPEKCERSVDTASVWQARQPVYTSSSGKWHRYERYLAPLVESLGGFEWIDSHVGRDFSS